MRESSLHLPSKEGVVRRALCVAATLFRLGLELALRGDDLASLRGELEKTEELLRQWLRQSELWDSLSPREEFLITLPLGDWRPQDVLSQSSRAEALGTLLWAVQLVQEFPPYDCEFDREELFHTVRLFSSPSELYEKAELRSAEELEKSLRRAEIWFWRANTTHRLLRRDPILLQGGYVKTVRQTLEKARREGWLEDATVQGDLESFGKAYFQLSAHEYSKSCEIVVERHLAFQWLCGYEEWE